MPTKQGKNVIISTTIRQEEYEDIKKNFWPMNHLIRLGVKAIQDNPQMIKRINELEGVIQRLQQRMTALGERNHELIIQLDNMRGGKSAADEHGSILQPGEPGAEEPDKGQGAKTDKAE